METMKMFRFKLYKGDHDYEQDYSTRKHNAYFDGK